MDKKVAKSMIIMTIVAVVVMAFCTVYDIMMVDKIIPITNVVWTRAECAWSITAAWSGFVLIWPATLATYLNHDDIEEMTK